MRKRINHRVTINSFKPTSFKSSTSEYNQAKTMLYQGFSLDLVFKKHILLESDKKLLRREEQILNMKDPNRIIITKLNEEQPTPIIKRIADEVKGIFLSNENLRNFALPSVK